MWNRVSGNKLLERKRKEEAFRKHVRALNTVKPMIDNSCPKEYSFLYSRPKAHQMKLGSAILSQNASWTSKTTTRSSSSV